MVSMNQKSLAELGPLEALVDRILAEDLASGDVTARCTVAPEAQASASIVAKESLVFCGGEVAETVFRRVDPELGIDRLVSEGEVVAAGAPVMRIAGNARAILAGERSALNLLQRVCGVATATRQYVDAAGEKLRVVDTRKTMPGLRALDRYAVRCGGGRNHRNDLGAGVLIKENHIRCSGGIEAAVKGAIRGASHGMRVECEVTTLDEAREAIEAGGRCLAARQHERRDVARGREAGGGPGPFGGERWSHFGAHSQAGGDRSRCGQRRRADPQRACGRPLVALRSGRGVSGGEANGS